MDESDDEPVAKPVKKGRKSAADKPAPRRGRASDAMDMDEDDEHEAEDEESPQIFFVINPPPEGRARFAHISNLAALRLLNDVDIRSAPAPPAGTKRIKPLHRLVDHDGWQEVYAGKTVWIYDSKSNADQCVRLVSGVGGPYGTASCVSRSSHRRAAAICVC